MRKRLIERVRRAYETYRNELFTYALAITRSQEAAEDAIHAAIAKVLNRDEWPRDFRPYLFRCVRNAAIDHRRETERRSGRESLFVESHGNGAPEGPGNGLDVMDALEDLREEERECVVLKCLDGLTFREIGAIHGVTVNTAASWYRRGLEKMRSALEEDA